MRPSLVLTCEKVLILKRHYLLCPLYLWPKFLIYPFPFGNCNFVFMSLFQSSSYLFKKILHKSDIIYLLFSDLLHLVSLGSCMLLQMTLFHSFLWPSKGKEWKQCQTLFFGAPKSLQMVIAAMKLKDAYSFGGKL